MVNTTAAYSDLLNMSVMKATNSVYTEAVGIWFWPIIFLFTLFLLAIKSENPAYVAFYAILGNIVLATKLPIETHPIFYAVIVFSLAMVLWSVYASKKVD